MNARETAVRAAVVKFFLDRLMEAKKAVATEVTTVLDPGDRKHARLEDGTDIGTVSVSDPKGTAKVVDERAFLAYVEENHPAAVVTTKQVVPGWQKSFLEGLDAVTDGSVYDPETAEQVPGVEHRIGSPTVTTRISPDQLDALFEAFRDGRLAEHMREVVTDRPALET